MYKPHKKAEKGFIEALEGRKVSDFLPRGPEVFEPSFAGSPNWTLLSRVADYIANNRHDARTVLLRRLDGELNGRLGFMLHEPHSRNYRRMHYVAYKALNYYASMRGDTELFNASLIWLHHFWLITCAGMLTEKNRTSATGHRKKVIGYEDCLAGMRTPESWIGETTIEAFVHQAFAEEGSSGIRGRLRSQVYWCYHRALPLGIGTELTPRQKRSLYKMMQTGTFCSILHEDVYHVGVRSPFQVLRTSQGVATGFEKKIADKDAVMAMSRTRGGETQYSMARNPRGTDIPKGKLMWRLEQGKTGIIVHE